MVVGGDGCDCFVAIAVGSIDAGTRALGGRLGSDVMLSLSFTVGASWARRWCFLWAVVHWYRLRQASCFGLEYSVATLVSTFFYLASLFLHAQKQQFLAD